MIDLLTTVLCGMTGAYLLPLIVIGVANGITWLDDLTAAMEQVNASVAARWGTDSDSKC